MPRPNSSVTSGDSSVVAFELNNGKKYEVIMLADSDGHVEGSNPVYLFSQTPRVTTAAATDFFDIFNTATSGVVVKIRGLWLVKQFTQASAIVPTFEFQAFRTNAIGTGGTPVTLNGAAAPAAGAGNIAWADSTRGALNAGVTARTLPTGGATAEDFLFTMHFSAEETAAFSEGSQYENLIPQLAKDQTIECNPGEGFKVRQITATASTGTNFGWLLAFAVNSV